MQHSTQPFHFSGNGGEYFRIWIVNIFLSLITLGIYSAWAKVRRNQYFYRHTHLDGAAFDYHGDPIVILKGRVVAFALFFAYSLAGQFSPTLAAVIFLLILLVMPWLLAKSWRFRLRNTSYRGLRFGFHGAYDAAYITFLLWPLFSAFSLGMLWPMAQQRITRYIRDNSAFGDQHFRFEAGSGAYYRAYAAIFLMAILIFILVGLGLQAAITLLRDAFQFAGISENQSVVAGIAGALSLYLTIFLVIFPYAVARMQNLIWNATRLGSHGFRSSLQARGLVGIMFTNLLLIILTLGLYKPFADIRLARYRIEHLEFLPAGSIDEIVAGVHETASAVGEEVADVFDLDIAL